MSALASQWAERDANLAPFMYSGERLLQLTGFQWLETSRWDQKKKMQRDSVWMGNISH